MWTLLACVDATSVLCLTAALDHVVKGPRCGRWAVPQAEKCWRAQSCELERVLCGALVLEL